MGLEQRRVLRASFLSLQCWRGWGRLLAGGREEGICPIGRNLEEQWFKKYYNPEALPPGASGCESYRNITFWERCLIWGITCPQLGKRRDGTGGENQKHGEDTQHLGHTREASRFRRVLIESVCWRGIHNKQKNSWLVATTQPLSDWKLFGMLEMRLVYSPPQPSFTQDGNTSSSLSLSSLHTKTILTDSFTLCHL